MAAKLPEGNGSPRQPSTALLARAEEAAAGTNTWQEHLAAGKRQHEELTARYAAAKDAEAEARRAYLSAHSAAASGEGRALDAE